MILKPFWKAFLGGSFLFTSFYTLIFLYGYLITM
ncbi:Protein of unknown function [Bacillus wiedmannii]|nr:Protein of unknown function [Bacillus wiedmannii]